MSGKRTPKAAGHVEPIGQLLAPRWARVERIRLIHREIRESLTPGAIDLLFAHGELVVEGGAEPGSGCVYATIMLTIPLGRCADRVREPVDTATAERLAELMRASPNTASRLAALARPHLARLAGTAQDALELAVETTVRTDGVQILIDGDAVARARSHTQR